MNPPFSQEEGIIRPVKGAGDPRMTSDAVMALVPPMLRHALALTEAEPAGRDAMGSGRFYRSRTDRWPPLTLAGPFLGAPQAVMAMERMIALGAMRLWVLGWCGSLQRHLGIGDMLVPTEAVSEEGTSRHYPLENQGPASTPALNTLIQGSLSKVGLHSRTGTVWTTDAPYRETPSKVLAYGRMGVLAVEMEMAALMTVALFRGVSLGGLLVVSDELFDLRWRTGFSSEPLKRASALAVETLLDAVGEWAKKPTPQALEIRNPKHEIPPGLGS